MRLFKVKDTGEFTEYGEQSFKSEHDERTLESWLEKNPESIVEDGALLIIGRQIATNLGSFVDLLALDREGNTAIIELKRERTPRDTVAQALEYASWAEGLEYDNLEQILRDYLDNDALSLLEYHRAFFKLEEAEGVSFNKDQRLVIVGYDISPEIRQTASFLRKKRIRATCVEFNYFQDTSKEQLMSVDIVIGKEPIVKGRQRTETRPATDEVKFLTDLDETARPIFNAVLAAAKKQRLPIHWGAVGFSINADIDGTHVALIMGYPRSSAYSQMIYTNVPSILSKVKDGPKVADSFKENLAKTELFKPAGNEMKYIVKQKPTEAQIEALLKILSELAEQIRTNGPVE